MTGAIHGVTDGGFERECDVIVVGSGAGGAVAAANCVEAGLRTILLEAGPKVDTRHMTRDAPKFLARYYWEGGIRMIHGPSPIPSMQGRCLGGSTVVNSAIMYALPGYMRQRWVDEAGLDWATSDAFDRSFDRVLSRTGVGPTPLPAMGPRNLVVRDALTAVGIDNGPLPRAVVGCRGANDCLNGCATGAKQSVDRSWIPGAVAKGLEVYTCAPVERVLVKGRQVTGVTGRVMDPDGWVDRGAFTVRAPKVIMAAGVMATPCILQRSRINPRRQMGATLQMHLSGGVIGMMEESTDPWIGATQGWGAISKDVQGLKYESLWAPASLLAVRWGDVGLPWMRSLQQMRYAAPIAVVYAGRTSGSVKVKRNGLPSMKLSIPKAEGAPVLRAMRRAAEGLFGAGARSVYTALPGLPADLRANQTHLITDSGLGPKHISMTGNHVFCSTPMSTDARRGPVDEHGRVRDTQGLWITDSGVFPTPSAVNPAATVMAVSDYLTRRMVDLPT